MRVQAQSKHEEAGECERKLHGSRDKHIPQWREHSQQPVVGRSAKEQKSGRLRRVAVVHGGVHCSDAQGTASHRKRQKPEKKQEGEREEKQKAVSREGLSPVRMHRTSNCLRRAPDGACALSTSSPRRLLTAGVFTVRMERTARRQTNLVPTRPPQHQPPRKRLAPRFGRQATTT